MGAYNYARTVTSVFAGNGPVKFECRGGSGEGKRVFSLQSDACDVNVFLTQEQWVNLASQIDQTLRVEEMDADMTAADQDSQKWPEKPTDALDGTRYALRGAGPTGQDHGDLCVCPACRLHRGEPSRE